MPAFQQWMASRLVFARKEKGENCWLVSRFPWDTTFDTCESIQVDMKLIHEHRIVQILQHKWQTVRWGYVVVHELIFVGRGVKVPLTSETKSSKHYLKISGEDQWSYMLDSLVSQFLWAFLCIIIWILRCFCQLIPSHILEKLRIILQWSRSKSWQSS